MFTPTMLLQITMPIVYLFLFLFIVLLIKILVIKGIKALNNKRKFKFQNQWLNDRQILDCLKSLKPAEFEEYIAHTYKNLGYSTNTVGGSYDGGVDVIAEKDGITSLIQCKRFNQSVVSVHDVRDFYGAMVDRLANGKGVFITTNIFSKEAERFAEGKPIELIDSFKLIKLIKIAEGKSNIDMIEPIEQLCPKCGGKLVQKSGKYGNFYGCSNFPKCEFTRGI